MNEPTTDDVPPQRPDEVEALAVWFLERLQAGEKPEREAVLRAHPHLADRLDRRLALIEMMYQVGLAPQPGRPSVAGTTGATGPEPGANPIPTVATGREAAGACGRPSNPPEYEILAELGRGGMGVVYQARHKRLNRIVALKMIRAGAHASPDLLARFHIEAEALASLQHPNIVQLYEVGTHDGCPYMAMEFLNGGSLDGHVTGQSPRAAAKLVETLARAMHAAHLRGIVHRDLKPANVLLAVSGQRSAISADREIAPAELTAESYLLTAIPKITDFGLAKRLTEGKGQTSTGAILGSPSYMAPEQAEGRVHDIGPATDVYALGAILYELFTGRPPFLGLSNVDTIKKVVSDEPAAPRRLCSKLPRDLETICLKCLEKEPAKRYATADSLADDLHRFLGGEPIAARPAGVAERAWKWARRRPAWALLIGVSVAATLALTALGISWSVQVRAERDRARHSLRVARQAIDDLYVKMASERLFDEPQLDPLCQELLEMARARYEELAQEQSADPDVRRDIALAWFRLGEIHRLQDQHTEAERAYGEAITRQEELRRDHRDEPRYRQDLANSHNWLGELLRERGRPADEVERHYRAALELQQGLVDEFDGEPTYRMELARSHYNLGIVLQDTNRLVEAQEHYDRALDLLTQLRKDDKNNPYYRQDLARALINRGRLHRSGNRPEEAGRDYEQAIDLLVGLRKEFPARAVYKFELAIARQNRGNLFWIRGQHAESRREQQKAAALYADAQQEYQAALTLLRGLVADFSSRPRYKKKMGTALKNQGTALASVHDPAGAEQCLDQARGVFEELAQRDPDTADYHGLLGMTLGQLGWLRTTQKNWRAARWLIEQGIEQMREALKSNRQRPDYRQELRDQYRDLAWVLVQLGDHAAAARAALEMTGVFPEQAQYRYFAACFLARCVPLTQDKQLARQYIEQAVALLQEAVAHAPPDLERIADEPEVFRPLQVHPKFGPAVRELDAKVPLAKAVP
jgi:tetratricopeptide (TPR) repeat protein/predicted Ser/Thr protein kinase